MNIIKIILYPSPPASLLGASQDLKLKDNLVWPKRTKGQAGSFTQNYSFAGCLFVYIKGARYSSWWVWCHSLPVPTMGVQYCGGSGLLGSLDLHK
jgi:hypothetical protein